MRIFGQDCYLAADFAARKLTMIARVPLGGASLQPGQHLVPGLAGFVNENVSWEDHDSLAAEHAAFTASVLDGAPVLVDATVGRRALAAALAVSENMRRSRERMTASGLVEVAGLANDPETTITCIGSSGTATWMLAESGSSFSHSSSIQERMRPAPPRDQLCSINHTLRAVAIGALVLLAATVLQDVLLLVFAAILAACVLHGAAAWLHKHLGLPLGLWLAIVIVLITVLFGAGLWLQGPRVTEQAAAVADTVTQQVQQLWQNVQDNPLIQRLMPQIKAKAGSILRNISSMVPGLASLDNRDRRRLRGDPCHEYLPCGFTSDIRRWFPATAATSLAAARPPGDG